MSIFSSAKFVYVQFSQTISPQLKPVARVVVKGVNLEPLMVF